MKKCYFFFFIVLFFTLSSTQAQKIVPPGVESGEFLGQSVSVFGNVAVAGAPGIDNGFSFQGKQGSAYIFEKVNNQWTFKQKVTPSDGEPDDFFGWSVSTDGTRILVGAPGNSVQNQTNFGGQAYLFQKQGNQWVEVQKFSPAVEGDGLIGFGWSVSIWDDMIMVGSPFRNCNISEPDCGRINTFLRDNNNIYQPSFTISEPDQSGFRRFGTSVSVSGNTAVTGAHNRSAKGIESGRITVFQVDNNGNVNFNKEIDASDGQASDHFGVEVSTFGDFLMVGTNQFSSALSEPTGSGKVYIYDPQFNESILLPEANKGFVNFGNRCAMGKNLAALTSFRQQGDLLDSYIHVFELENNSWKEKIKYKTDATPSAATFSDVALFSTTVMGGSSDDATNGTDAGSVYFFDAGVTNTPPQLAIQGNVVTDEDVSVDVNFTASDAETPPANLKVKIISTKPDLIVPDGIQVFGNGNAKILRLKGVPNADGIAVIKVVLYDEQGYTDEKLVTVTVNPVNDPPVFNLSKTNIVLEGNSAQETLEAVLDLSAIPNNEFGEPVTFTVTPPQTNLASVSVEDMIVNNNSAAKITLQSIPSQFGTQEFTVTADDGNIVNGTFEQKFTLQVKGMGLFPNPASEEVIFRAAGVQSEAFTLSFTDARGVVCKELSLPSKNQVLEEKISLRDLSKGLYFVKISGNTAGEAKSIKLIKE